MTSEIPPGVQQSHCRGTAEWKQGSQWVISALVQAPNETGCVETGKYYRLLMLQSNHSEVLMLHSAGRAHLPNHTHRPLIRATARCYNTVTGLSCEPPSDTGNTQDAPRPLRNSNASLCCSRGNLKRGFLLPTCQGWRLDKCWGLGGTSSPRGCPPSLSRLHLVSSGPLLASVEGRATAEVFVLTGEQLKQQESQLQPVN